MRSLWTVGLLNVVLWGFVGYGWWAGFSMAEAKTAKQYLDCYSKIDFAVARCKLVAGKVDTYMCKDVEVEANCTSYTKIRTKFTCNKKADDLPEVDK